jgi:hypothetical protein
MQSALRKLLASGFLVSVFSLTMAVQAMTMNSLSPTQYNEIKQSALDKPQLDYDDIAPLLMQHQQNPLFRFTQLGQSALGTPIWHIDIGSGPVKILAWSQMHGNESTATAALMDLLNFIAAESQKNWRDNWLSKVSIRLIPMVNPDGAAAGVRLSLQAAPTPPWALARGSRAAPSLRFGVSTDRASAPAPFSSRITFRSPPKRLFLNDFSFLRQPSISPLSA